MIQIDRDNLHHAYGVIRRDDTTSDLLAFFEKELGVTLVGNPDFVHEQFETLSIDDSRRIKEIALARRFSAEVPRVFLIELFGITREAQNALLKLFEEPQEGNHFFLVLPSFDILLPTLRSRLSLHHAGLHGAAAGDAIAAMRIDPQIEVFLKSPLKEKIAFVDGLAADISDEKKAKHEALLFLNNLERALYIKSAQNIGAHKSVFDAIARARGYLNDRAPSVKMLLEYIALTV